MLVYSFLDELGLEMFARFDRFPATTCREGEDFQATRGEWLRDPLPRAKGS